MIRLAVLAALVAAFFVGCIEGQPDEEPTFTWRLEHEDGTDVQAQPMLQVPWDGEATVLSTIVVEDWHGIEVALMVDHMYSDHQPGWKRICTEAECGERLTTQHMVPFGASAVVLLGLDTDRKASALMADVLRFSDEVYVGTTTSTAASAYVPFDPGHAVERVTGTADPCHPVPETEHVMFDASGFADEIIVEVRGGTVVACTMNGDPVTNRSETITFTAHEAYRAQEWDWAEDGPPRFHPWMDVMVDLVFWTDPTSDGIVTYSITQRADPRPPPDSGGLFT